MMEKINIVLLLVIMFLLVQMPLLLLHLKIGDASIVAAGSAINRDVPSESLAIARPIQQNKIGLGKKIMLKLQKVADKIKK